MYANGKHADYTVLVILRHFYGILFMYIYTLMLFELHKDVCLFSIIKEVAIQ